MAYDTVGPESIRDPDETNYEQGSLCPKNEQEDTRQDHDNRSKAKTHLNRQSSSGQPSIDLRSGEHEGIFGLAQLAPKDGIWTTEVLWEHLQEEELFRDMLRQIDVFSLSPLLRVVFKTWSNTSPHICSLRNETWSNRTKSFLEDYTSSEWDWWPLGPCVPSSEYENRFEWKVSVFPRRPRRKPATDAT